MDLRKIEQRAATARLAALYIKSVRVAALYTSGPVVGSITWSMPVAPSETQQALPGVSVESITRPADTALLLGTGSAAGIESAILSAAWSWGAWDVRRIEHAPLADPALWRDPRHGIRMDFGHNDYVINGSPLVIGERSDSAAQVAAQHGHVTWTIIPLSLSTPAMRARWTSKDRTLADDATRGPRIINPMPLYGRQEIGHGHEHIYQLGRANHGNRSKSSGARRA